MLTGIDHSLAPSRVFFFFLFQSLKIPSLDVHTLKCMDFHSRNLSMNCCPSTSSNSWFALFSFIPTYRHHCSASFPRSTTVSLIPTETPSPILGLFFLWFQPSGAAPPHYSFAWHQANPPRHHFPHTYPSDDTLRP